MADSAEQAHASKSDDDKAGEGKEAPAPSEVGGEASSGSAAAPAAEGGAPAAATAGGGGDGGKELTEEEQRAIRRANRKRKSGWEVVPDPVQPSTLSAGDAAVLALQQQQQALSQAAQSAILQRASVPLPAGMSLVTPAAAAPSVPGGRLYVGSLNYDISEMDLRSIFSPFGPIKTIDMSFEPATGKTKGFAFVEFFDALQAEACQRSMDGFNLAGRNIKIGRPHGGAGGAGGGAAAPVVPGSLAFQMPAGFQALPALQAPLAMPALAGSLPATGLQTAGALLAAQAVQKLQQSQVVGPPAAQPGLPTRIYVGSVMFEIGENELKGIFGSFGPIKTVNMIPNPETGKHKGYGFIDFESHESAQNAITTMNGFDLGGRSLKIGWANSAIQPASPAVDVSALATAQAAAMSFMQGGVAGVAAAAPVGVQQQVVASVSLEENTSISSAEQRASLMQKLAQGTATPSLVVCLKNMVDPHEVDADLEGEIKEECTKYGTVDNVSIQKLVEGGSEKVKIFVRFSSVDTSAKAITALHKRWFGGKVVNAAYYDEAKFNAGDYTG